MKTTWERKNLDNHAKMAYVKSKKIYKIACYIRQAELAQDPLHKSKRGDN